ncbi:MAG: serine hydrolase [Balneolales bacterium]
MRLLKFLGFFLAFAIPLIGSIFFLNRDVFFSVYENREALADGSEWIEKTYSLSGLVEFIEEHPRHVSVVSYDIDDPESGIYFQPNKKRVMGTLGHIFMLIEYARQVSAGELDPEELVSLDAIARYQLPNIEANSHREAVRSLRDRDRVMSGKRIRISDAVSMMIRHNNLGAADFLYYFLGPQNITELVAGLGGSRIDAPLPWSGLHISVNPSFHETTAAARYGELLSRTAGDRTDEVQAYALAYQNDEAFRNRVSQSFRPSGLGISFRDERLMYGMFPRADPVALAGILEQIMRGELISGQASAIVTDYLSWPMESGNIVRNFDFYAALYDNRISLLNGLDLGTSTYTKTQHVQVVLFEQLPVGFWMHMSSNFMNQDYQQRLIYDPALYETSKSALTP